MTVEEQSAHLGTVIRARRKSLDISQEDLASLAGVSARFIVKLERGKPTVRLDSMLAVCDALGLTLELA